MALVHLSSESATRTIINDSVIRDQLREITRFLVNNKNHLPDDSRALLSETFGKSRESTSKNQLQPRASGARARIALVRDVHPSPQLLSYLETFRRSPIMFWIEGLTLKVGWENKNLLRAIYRRNRAVETGNVIHRAFDTTATYLLLLKICNAFNTNMLSQTVLKYCYTIILGQASSEEEREFVKQNLKADFHAGKRWHAYATKLGGYGVYFLIGVVPSWMFEITWNKTDDFEFVISHFRSIKVPEIAMDHNLHGIGNRIMSDFTSRTRLCIPPKTREKRRKRPATANNVGKPNKHARLKQNAAILDDSNMSLPCEASPSTTIPTPSRESAFVVDRDVRAVQRLTQPSPGNLPPEASNSRRSGLASRSNGALSSFLQDGTSTLAHSQTHPNGWNANGSTSRQPVPTADISSTLVDSRAQPGLDGSEQAPRVTLSRGSHVEQPSGLGLTNSGSMVCWPTISSTGSVSRDLPWPHHGQTTHGNIVQNESPFAEPPPDSSYISRISNDTAPHGPGGELLESGQHLPARSASANPSYNAIVTDVNQIVAYTPAIGFSDINQVVWANSDSDFPWSLTHENPGSFLNSMSEGVDAAVGEVAGFCNVTQAVQYYPNSDTVELDPHYIAMASRDVNVLL
ncbi:hypothetical protein BJY01DRAFT_229512 [Aspergillus pseudoustus]|uniref:Uncharacterized protein n=1 Tax=Aspergillus pseudoustus TaxID=1810923 RepID=A0ABR4II39_9EURO